MEKRSGVLSIQRRALLAYDSYHDHQQLTTAEPRWRSGRAEHDEITGHTEEVLQ